MYTIKDIKDFAISKIPSKQGEQLLAMAKDVEQSTVQLPLDTNGDPIHINDRLKPINNDYSNTKFSVQYIKYSQNKRPSIGLLNEKDSIITPQSAPDQFEIYKETDDERLREIADKYARTEFGMCSTEGIEFFFV